MPLPFMKAFALGQGKPAINLFGAQVRRPFQSEQEFFDRSGVNAYAAEDGAVVYNPNAAITAAAKHSLLLNEASRQWQKRNGFKPQFELTNEQRKVLAGTAYANASPEDRQATILSRVFAEDPSAGQITAEQQAAVNRMRYGMGVRTPINLPVEEIWK